MVSRLLAFCFCLFALPLAACAPVQAPLGMETTAPYIAGDVFVTHDGLRLPVQTWAAVNPRAVIVALHGMSDYSHAFARPAPWWAARGLTVYAYDQRGFGRSPNLGLWPGGDALRRDLADFVDAVRAKYPGLPVFALGESMGGAVVLSSLSQGPAPHVDGVILVAPAVWSRADMPWLYRASLWLAAHVAPGTTFTGKGVKIWPSDNIAMLRENFHDPLFQKKTRADAIWGLVNLMDEARAAPGKLNNPPPILLLYGAHDLVIPNAPTEAVIKALGAKVDARKFPYGYHMLLRDLRGIDAWQAVVEWTEKVKRK
jgi:acylglycerol lipase